jgi:hypothetical protein
MVQFRHLLCHDDERRAALRLRNGVYGVDFVEVRTEPLADNQRALELHFQDKANESLDQILDALDQRPERFLLTGGVRVRNPRVISATRQANVIELRVGEPGDFSNYRLRVDHPQMDPVFAEVEFSFKAGCPSPFDCRPKSACEHQAPEDPAIDYQARDYASFRQALLDRITLTNPEWRERSPADLGITVLELLAYAADRLSYHQDAVATEAYLETATQRISVRRHARLIDYRMHDGLSARAFVHFISATSGEIPAGVQILTRLTDSLRGKPAPHPATIPSTDAADAAELAAVVFESEQPLRVDPGLNEIPLVTWGRKDCCLPVGATSVDLVGPRNFKPGDLMLLEEVRGTASAAAPVDRTHRQVVRLVAVSPIIDPLDQAVHTRVTWDAADALAIPFRVSLPADDGTVVDGVTVARGNMVIVHQGHRREVELSDVDRQIRLAEGPVSHWPSSGATEPVAILRQTDPRKGSAAVKISQWKQVESMLDSDAADSHFVVEIDNTGRAVLRFGDGVAGRAVATGPGSTPLDVVYHVGLGPGGNVASDSLAHVIEPVNLTDFPVVTGVRNPLPGWGGAAPEPLEQVRLTAPAALRQGLERAVTEADYAEAAERMPEVSHAVATFRWTGSWRTVFLAIDPVGGAELTPQLRQRIATWVGRFVQAGYDLKITDPVYVPLEIEVHVCTADTHFRAQVLQSLLRELGTGQLAGGRPAFFHPDRFTFGQPLYLSQLSATLAAVPGVRSAKIVRLQRFGKAANNELESGAVRVGRTEIIRCDNDPNFVERGVLRLRMEGGK